MSRKDRFISNQPQDRWMVGEDVRRAEDTFHSGTCVEIQRGGIIAFEGKYIEICQTAVKLRPMPSAVNAHKNTVAECCGEKHFMVVRMNQYTSDGMCRGYRRKQCPV